MDCVWASASPDEQPWQPRKTSFGLTPSLSDPISKRRRLISRTSTLGFGVESALNVGAFTAAYHWGAGWCVFNPFLFFFSNKHSMIRCLQRQKRWFQSSPTCENSKIRAHLKYIDDNVGFKVKPARLHFHLGRHFVTYLTPLSTSRM